MLASREFIHRPHYRATKCQDPSRLSVRLYLLLLCDRSASRCLHINTAARCSYLQLSKGLMPAMAGDWHRDPRGYGSAQSSEPPISVRMLPSVAELLSSRPSANNTTTTYHRQEYFHGRSAPPSVSLPPTTASATMPYWNAMNHSQTSPPVR